EIHSRSEVGVCKPVELPPVSSSPSIDWQVRSLRLPSKRGRKIIREHPVHVHCDDQLRMCSCCQSWWPGGRSPGTLLRAVHSGKPCRDYPAKIRLPAIRPYLRTQQNLQ